MFSSAMCSNAELLLSGWSPLHIWSTRMSGGLDVLALKEEDVTRYLACGTHLGSNNSDFQMEQYVYKRKPDGVYW